MRPAPSSTAHEPLGGLGRSLPDVCLLALCLTVVFVTACSHEIPRGHRLPPTIADIEEGARDIIDLLNASQWERADTRAGLLLTTTARLEAVQGRQFPDLERAIGDLDHAIESHDALQARRSANDVMRQAVILGFDQLDESSATVLMLDVETREVLIVTAADPMAADVAVARIGALWRGLRPEVDRRGQIALLTQFDEHVHALETGPAATRGAEAAALLEAIDQLYELFS